MNIYLYGHDYKYCAEQMLLTLYPAERPVYPAGPCRGDSVALSLRRGAHFVSASCVLHRGEAVSRGSARLSLEKLGTGEDRVRMEQRLLKFAFYRAAVNGGHEKPVWGCLTGVRPAKFFAGLLHRDGLSFSQAEKALVRDFDVDPDRAALCARSAAAAEEVRAGLLPEDVCLYIGIPYCPTRCAYCSFVSVEAPRMLETVPVYLDALEREMASVADAVKRTDRRIIAVYVGGGTPTTLSAEELDRLLERTAALFDLSACREFTVEAGRPDTITAEKLAVLRRRGIDRVSVNPQSMSDKVLSAIGRRHTVGEIRDAVALVKEAGISFNMDLIAGLPEDTPESFAATVDEVMAFAPDNITIHTLALKKGSYFLTHGRDALPDGESVGKMLAYGARSLTAAGYSPYYMYRQKFMSGSFENVGWTRPGRENLYNICIMEELCGILALGAGGSTKLVAPGGIVQRIMDPKYPREYMEHIQEICASKEQIVEFYQHYYPKQEV